MFIWLMGIRDILCHSATVYSAGEVKCECEHIVTISLWSKWFPISCLSHSHLLLYESKAMKVRNSDRWTQRQPRRDRELWSCINGWQRWTPRWQPFCILMILARLQGVDFLIMWTHPATENIMYAHSDMPRVMCVPPKRKIMLIFMIWYFKKYFTTFQFKS